MRCPGIARDVVFAPARIAARLRLHFEKHEIAESALVEPPRRAEPGHPSANNHDRNADLLRRSLKRRMIAEPMSHRKTIVDKRAANARFPFRRQPDETGAEGAPR